MTENKRFTISGDRSISDHHKKRLYDLSNFDGVISVNECLNELHEEKEQLEKENKQLKEQLKSEHQMLENAIILERTRMGKNSLKQYQRSIE